VQVAYIVCFKRAFIDIIIIMQKQCVVIFVDMAAACCSASNPTLQ
jgi:hypothetical protein